MKLRNLVCVALCVSACFASTLEEKNQRLKEFNRALKYADETLANQADESSVAVRNERLKSTNKQLRQTLTALSEKEVGQWGTWWNWLVTEDCGGGPICAGSCLKEFEAECDESVNKAEVCTDVLRFGGATLPQNANRCNKNACGVLDAFTECHSLDNGDEIMSSLTVPPETATAEPWFKYVVWLDQAVSANGGDNLNGRLSLPMVDPEALAVVIPPTSYSGLSESVIQNRCHGSTWSLWGGDTSAELHSGPSFWKDIASKNCDLTFNWEPDHKVASIGGYWHGVIGSQWLGSIIDNYALEVTIELNKNWELLFNATCQSEWTVALNQDFASRCCQALTQGPDPVWDEDLDPVAACNPYVEPACALYYRRNWAGWKGLGWSAPGAQGYAVYPVGRLDGDKWVPLPEQYAQFKENLKAYKGPHGNGNIRTIFWGK